jgi:hypothetical protein
VAATTAAANPSCAAAGGCELCQPNRGCASVSRLRAISDSWIRERPAIGVCRDCVCLPFTRNFDAEASDPASPRLAIASRRSAFA